MSTGAFACAPYRARTKGKDERSVGYVKRNGIAGREFASWAELDAHLDWWLRDVADVRVHGTTGERPIDRFKREAAALRPVADRPPFAARRTLSRRVQSMHASRSIPTTQHRQRAEAFVQRIRDLKATFGIPSQLAGLRAEDVVPIARAARAEARFLYAVPRSLDQSATEKLVGQMLIETTCQSPPVVVGHVLGGALAARFAARHSDRLAGLVLVDSLGLAPFRPAPKFGLTMMHFMLQPNERTYGRFMQQCSADLGGLQQNMGEQWEPFMTYNVSSAGSPQTKAAVRALMRRVGLPPIPSEELARIDVPTTLIWGRLDRANRLRVAEAASERYGWPLRVIEDSADDPARDQPEAFVRTLREVLGES